MSDPYKELNAFIRIQHLDHIHVVKRSYFFRNLKRSRRIICGVCLGEIRPEKVQILFEKGGYTK